MRYLSVCSGIEAATVAWHPLGWNPAAFAEIDKFPSLVLKHRYPDVPNVGDFTQIRGDEYGAIDLLVGGTPCQDFSVAGLRAGMDGKRGQLTIEFARLAERLRPRWLVWENVPGVLSIDNGRAFGTFLGLLGKLGYGFAYRVLDAQFFGVPQRRRRVFVVGHLGDWRRAAAVLFERHSLSGHPAPRREAARQGTSYDVAPCIGASGRGFERTGDTRGQDCCVPVYDEMRLREPRAGRHECDGAVLAGVPDSQLPSESSPRLPRAGRALVSSTGEISHCLNGGGMGRQDFETETLIAHSLRGGGFDASEDGTGRGTPLVPVIWLDQEFNASDEQLGTLKVGGRGGFCPPTIAFDSKASGRNGFGIGEVSPTLRSMGHKDSHTNAGGQVAVAMNLRGRDGGAMPELDGVASLRAASGGSSRSYVMYEQEEEYASTYEADASSVLSTLRKEVGAEAVAEWGSRILDSLQSEEVLRSWMHGKSLRRSSSNFRSFVDDRALSCTKNMPEGTLRTVWALGPNGRTSQGRGLAKQLAQQLGKALPELPSSRASESIHSGVMAVRRLTPIECEKLQGFPPNYTKISEKTADGPRYKALGNSMAVPVMRWLGERIQMVEDLTTERQPQ